jgi:hypothetical protein
MKLFASIGLLLSPLMIFSQLNLGYDLIDSVMVVKNGETLSAPWAGGLNNPQFSSVDVTGDSDLELFVFDRDGALRKGFKYNSELDKYQWIRKIPESGILFQNLFPRVDDRGFCLLRDYDADGDMDVFSNKNFDKIAVHRNDGAGEFTLVDEQLSFTKGSTINSLRMVKNAIPVIKDLDEDGDLDIMYFPVNISPFNCNAFASFMNQSIEEYGNADSLEFTIGSYCWGQLRVGANPESDIFTFEEYECAPNSCQEVAARGKDITMTQNLHDINGDGDLDLLVTYDHNNELFYTPNFGGNLDGDVDLGQTDYAFPSNDEKVLLSNEPYPYFLDVDLDGDDDMLIGSNQINSVNSTENDTAGTVITDVLYKNVGSDGAPVFELHKKGFLSGEMIDVGMQSMPAFGDLNGDSLQDLIIGNIGYNNFREELSGAQIHFYANIGSTGKPVYENMDISIYGLAQLNLKSAHPALADLDGDGDDDLLIGDHTGHLQYFENTGNASTPTFSTLVPNFEQIDAGGAAHPQFFDLNNDGLLDLIIGDEYGRIQYYENQGTPSEPNFPAAPTINNMGRIDILSSHGGQASPYMTRSIDSTGAAYLFLGTADGQVNIYGPISNFSDSFLLSDSIILEATNTSIAGSDIIGGYRSELIIGQRAGGLYMLQKENDQPVGYGEVTHNQASIRVYPNPANETAFIKTYISGAKQANLIVADLSGRPVHSHLISAQNSQFQYKIDLSNFPSGVYIVSIKASESTSWAKLIKE